jgi:hypothetical protein
MTPLTPFVPVARQVPKVAVDSASALLRDVGLPDIADLLQECNDLDRFKRPCMEEVRDRVLFAEDPHRWFLVGTCTSVLPMYITPHLIPWYEGVGVLGGVGPGVLRGGS